MIVRMVLLILLYEYDDCYKYDNNDYVRGYDMERMMDKTNNYWKQ